MTQHGKKLRCDLQPGQPMPRIGDTIQTIIEGGAVRIVRVVAVNLFKRRFDVQVIAYGH